MRIGRTLPPAAAPVYLRNIFFGLKGLFRGQRELHRFSSELKEYFGVKHCFLVSSGKTALTIILQSLKDIYPDRDQVIIPAFTCYSVPSAIVRAGLKIQLCDVRENTLDFDFLQLRRIVSSSSFEKVSNNFNKKRLQSNKPNSSKLPLKPPLCIIPMHLFGIPADIAGLRDVIADLDIVIVEDAAQALGASCQNKKLGTLGDVNFFSLGRGKAFSTIEGGIILTNRDDIACKIAHRIETISRYSIVHLMILFFKSIFLAFFQHPSLFWIPKLLPFLRLGETIYDPTFKMRRMSAFQAGLAKSWKKRLKDLKKCRAKNSRLWMEIFKNSSKIVPFTLEDRYLANVIRFPLKVNDPELRTIVLRKSNQMGLGIMPSYPDTINRILELRDNFCGLEFPRGKKSADRLITLPVHPFVSQKDSVHIAKLLTESKYNTST